VRALMNNRMPISGFDSPARASAARHLPHRTAGVFLVLVPTVAYGGVSLLGLISRRTPRVP
jgi:hypothetical protein